MVPQRLHQRIEVLIDELIEEGNVATASLASIFVAAQEAVAGGYDVALCRHIWSGLRELEWRRQGPSIAIDGEDDGLSDPLACGA